MSKVKEFFVEIDRDEISADMTNLVADGHIDSLDIMALVAQIEKYYQKPLDAKFIDASNFESFAAIENMLNLAYK